MGNMLLRAADASEIAAVLAFWQTAAENGHRPADTGRAVATLHLRDPDALILAVDGDEIVGTVIAGWDGWRCHLYRLAVAPGRRREGIGRALIEAARNASGSSAAVASTRWCSTTTSRHTPSGGRTAIGVRRSGPAGSSRCPE